MPLTDDMQLVSVDDHLVERPGTWAERLPRKYVDRGPRIAEAKGDETDQYGLGQSVPKGSQVWMLEDGVHPQLGLNAVAGKSREQIGTDPLRFDDMIPGCYDPAARVQDMDIDGVQAQLLFPSFPKFAGTMFQTVKDPELALLCTKTWNDFVHEEWVTPYPDRFIPIGILPYWDLEASIAELRRLADRGVRAISFPENPVPLGHPSFHTDHWDPLFDVFEEVDAVVCIHFGTSGLVRLTAPEAPMAVMITLAGVNSINAVGDLLFSPVFHRHPNIKFSVAEGGIGWIPWLLERADITWERHRYYQNINQTARPSDLFQKHIWGCFITDHYGVKNRHSIGVDKVTWECDYPHSDSFWPNSRKIVAEMFADVPDEEVRRMVETNARDLYRFPRT
jgi:predicted TIM-barrel fold metal-dependent hydrolase